MRQQQLKPGRGVLSTDHHSTRGSIVTLISLASEGAFQGVTPYVAAKHACVGLIQNAGK